MRPLLDKLLGRMSPSEKKLSRLVSRIFHGVPEWFLPHGWLGTFMEGHREFMGFLNDLRPHHGPLEKWRRIKEDWRIVRLPLDEILRETELPLIDRPDTAGHDPKLREEAVEYWLAREGLRDQWIAAGIAGRNRAQVDANHRREIVLDNRLDTVTAYRLAGRIDKMPEHLRRELHKLELYEERGWREVFPPLPELDRQEPEHC